MPYCQRKVINHSPPSENPWDIAPEGKPFDSEQEFGNAFNDSEKGAGKEAECVRKLKCHFTENRDLFTFADVKRLLKICGSL